MSNCFNTNASSSLMYSVSKLKIMACFWGVIVGFSIMPCLQCRVLVLLSVCKYHCNKRCIKMQMSCEFDHVLDKFCLFTEASFGWENLAADPRIHASWTESGAVLYLFICSSESYQKINLSQANVSMKLCDQEWSEFITHFMTQNIITTSFNSSVLLKLWTCTSHL